MVHYRLKPCKECGCKATIYGSGLAKSFLDGEEWKITFVDFDGYTVECEECGRGTDGISFRPELATEEWNNMN